MFFYSADTFHQAGIRDEHIQYAVLATGVIYTLGTFVCVPLVDRLGRRPLLVSTLLLTIVNYVLITVFISLKVSPDTFDHILYCQKAYYGKLGFTNFAVFMPNYLSC